MKYLILIIAIAPLIAFGQVTVTDNRLKSEKITFSVKEGHVEYKATLFHYKWSQLSYSDTLTLGKDGYYTKLKNWLLLSKNNQKKLAALPEKFISTLSSYTCIMRNESKAKVLVINKKQDMFIKYFQELLILEVSKVGEKEIVQVLIPANSTSTLAINTDNNHSFVLPRDFSDKFKKLTIEEQIEFISKERKKRDELFRKGEITVNDLNIIQSYFIITKLKKEMETSLNKKEIEKIKKIYKNLIKELQHLKKLQQ